MVFEAGQGKKENMSTLGISGVTVQLAEAELKLLQALIYQECGMHFDERRTHFLQDRLQRRLKECQLDSFYSYYRLLISHEGKQELARLLENLTVNETSFFRDRKSTRLNSSHLVISYAVFCLKKKKTLHESRPYEP